MANEEHLARLKEGADAWNAWRKADPKMHADLSRANLSRANLSGVYLYRANLTRANLRDATLSRATLTRAELGSANLTRATLLTAYLSDANLHNADLSSTNLSGTRLDGANLTSANLCNANLSGVVMGDTTLVSLDLSQVQGLESVHHLGPSYIGIDTIYKSQGQIPEVFLRGAGVPENFIEYMRSLTGKAFVYYSCFISHSSKDAAFCQRLYNDLQGAGVRCWLDSEDLKIGDRFWERIDESIRLHDKLLVVLSEHSVESDWVEDEVLRALNKEREQPERTVLFPIRLDDAVMTARHAWATSIRMKRHIGDFSRWKEHDAYQQAFARLLRDLRGEGGAAGG